MTLFRHYTLFLILFIAALDAHAQMMQGKIYDVDGKKPLKDVIIHNIFSEEIVYSDENGRFRIEVRPGELVEFKMYNYKTSRVRIHDAPASYYEVPMAIGPFELEGLTVYGRDASRKIDSIKTAEVFQKALRTKKLEGMDAFQHPISALSKENRRIWAFQERYRRTEQEKYIEYVFNPELIRQLTALGEDSIEDYRRRFRPTIDWLTEWNEYDYYLYIKNSVATYRTNSAYYRKE
ncbi:MAG: hypothetical protein KL787_05250 [Taibaiella sp.]|nr:hypothetical protein [Taibaiella sp.]